MISTHQTQRWLSEAGVYKGRVDGDWGPQSTAAAVALLSSEAPQASRWAASRLQLAVTQLMLRRAGIDAGAVDGLMGPQTHYAIDVWEARQDGREREVMTWRDREPAPAAQPRLQQTVWPVQSDVERYYGRPGENQTTLVLPRPMRVAWNTRQTIRQFSVHERVHDSMLRCLTRVADAYTEEQARTLGLDLWGGCLNVRRMRGGSAWSMHSWGIALDLDPERNQLRWGRDRARLAQPDADRFWTIWEDEGWVSLGREKNYDWMHVQAARV